MENLITDYHSLGMRPGESVMSPGFFSVYLEKQQEVTAKLQVLKQE